MSRTRRFTVTLGLAALLALPLGSPTPATAGTERYTTISSFPYTISTPGGYKLASNLGAYVYSTAITVTCDNVVIDLDGYTITNTMDSPAIGVSASGRSNVTVRNGKLRAFGTGVSLSQGLGLVVEELTVIDAKINGITIGNASGGIVRRCNVTNTGYPNFSNAGIRMTGKNAYVLDNVVTNTKYGTFSSPSVGIDVTGSDRAVVARNNVANETMDPMGASIGIRADGDFVYVVENQIAYFHVGVMFASGSQHCVYRDNFAEPCSAAKYSGGTNGGGNL